jgi:putative aminopeptidase FrvX
MHAMRPESLEFLKAIVNAPSPSGYEERAAKIYREYTTTFADESRTDSHGNVYAILNPKAATRIMLSGHLDEIGFIVKYISDDGLVYFTRIGGHDTTIAVGQHVWVHGKLRVPGVIGRKPIHLMTSDERGKVPEFSDLWVDVGASTKAEAMEQISLGDVITYMAEYRELMGDRAAARGFDNKVGAFIVAEALRYLKEDGGLHKDIGVYATGTVQEEVGLRGATTASFTIDAKTGIAVDVSFSTDYPSVAKEKHGEAHIRKGPLVTRGSNINPNVFRMLNQAGTEDGIPFQIEVEGGSSGTDAEAMQISRGGMATGLLGVPIRYMHTPCELLSLTDVENCAKLMAAYCRRVTPETDFTPRLLD